ncbi:lactoylglutathione lyase [Bacillus niacini]|uniref:Lactoylglutathione lyase n=1 Tax=Neobacillus niacini TaxID=86668 RepID=A0A852TCQ4_9BACI|nr:VOC family protein [Neobacillus niacini]NYE05178.1 lactoylglutathione lyase [Neobacillus niacini]
MHFHHIAIEVKDLETSAAFYQKYIGLQEESRFLFGGEKIIFLKADNFRMELISTTEQSSNNHSSIHLCFEVDSIDDVTQHFNENGIFAIDGPYKLENGWETIFYQGPENEIIEFMQIGRKADK